MPRRLNPPSVFGRVSVQVRRSFGKSLPWPYSGMVNDLIGAIQTRGNYMAALGLLCYSEACGRQWFCKGSGHKDNARWLGEFLKYAGAGAVLKRRLHVGGKKITFANAVRNGIVHQYFMKLPRSGVAMVPHPDHLAEATETGFVIREPDQIQLVVVPFFDLFCTGLKKAKSDGHLGACPSKRQRAWVCGVE